MDSCEVFPVFFRRAYKKSRTLRPVSPHAHQHLLSSQIKSLAASKSAGSAPLPITPTSSCFYAKHQRNSRRFEDIHARKVNGSLEVNQSGSEQKRETQEVTIHLLQRRKPTEDSRRGKSWNGGQWLLQSCAEDSELASSFSGLSLPEVED